MALSQPPPEHSMSPRQQKVASTSSMVLSTSTWVSGSLSMGFVSTTRHYWLEIQLRVLQPIYCTAPGIWWGTMRCRFDIDNLQMCCIEINRVIYTRRDITGHHNGALPEMALAPTYRASSAIAPGWLNAVIVITYNDVCTRGNKDFVFHIVIVTSHLV